MATGKAIGNGPSGPGEQLTFDRLRADLPDSWHVVWGRDIPTNFVDQLQRETDFIVVGDHLIFVCEEKHWPGVFTGNALHWFRSDGTTFGSPLKQATDLSKKLSGVVHKAFPEIEAAMKAYNLNRGGVGTIPTGLPHVVLSHPSCDFSGVSDPRTENACTPLELTAEALVARDSKHSELEILGDPDIRERLKTFLDGLEERPPRTHINSYEVIELVRARANGRVYRAQHESGAERLLVTVSLSEVPNPADDIRKQYEREAAALKVLAGKGVTPTAYDYFYTDDNTTLVIPMDPIRGRQSLDGLVGVSPPSTSEFLELADSTLRALGTIHGAHVVHRGLTPNEIWVPATTEVSGVMFTGFSAARISGHETLSALPWLEGDDSSFIAPELRDGFGSATPASDVYSAIRSLAAYLIGALPESGSDSELYFARLPHALAESFARALAEDPAERPTLAQLLDAISATRISQSAGGCQFPSDFEVDERLGVGATATTYRVRDLRSPEPPIRALKVFHPSHSLATIQKEVVVLENLRHPHIVGFFEAGGEGLRIGHEGTCRHLVYQYVDGRTLNDSAASLAVLPSADRAERLRSWLVDALDALTLVHSRGYVHRDIKPGNLLVSAAEDGAERLMLLDFGQAEPAGAVGTGGTPFYRDVLINSPATPWHPTNDLYSLAVSFFYATTGSLPFNLDAYGNPEKHSLVGPIGSDNGSRVLQQRLLRAISPQLAQRYPDAAAFKAAIEEPIQAELGASANLEFRVNPTVAELRRYYRNSRLGATANRGLGGSFGRATYVATKLDQELMPAVLNGELSLVLFAGNPGDGKTTFLEQLAIRLTGLNADCVYDTQAGWERRLNGRRFIAVNDASASVGATSADEYLEEVLAPLVNYDGGSTDFTILVAANDGRLLNAFTESPYFQRIGDLVRRALLDNEVDPGDDRVRIIDFKRRALVDGSNPDQSIVLKTLAAATDPSLWEVCEDCRAKDQCPIRFNAQSLGLTGDGTPGRRLHDLFVTSHLRRQTRLTIRDLRSVVSWVVTGDLSCQEVHDDVQRGQSPLQHRRLYSWLATSGDGGDDVGLDQLNQLDPNLHASPGLDRVLVHALRDGWDALGPARLDELTGRSHVPTRLFNSSEAIAVNRRRFFFEGDPASPAVGSDPLRMPEMFSPYRFRDRFMSLAAGGEVHHTVKEILLGCSRAIGVSGYDGPGLAVRPPTTSATDATVVKVFPESQFELASVPTSPWVESLADQVVLRGTSGSPRIVLSLDAFELIGRCAAGYLPVHPEASPLVEELAVFGRQLMQRPADEVLIIDAAGNGFAARTVAGQIALVES